MIYLNDTDYKEWAETHGIEPVIIKCKGCNNDFLTNIPVYTKLSYGLCHALHGCDEKHRVFIFVPRCKKTRELFIDFLNKQASKE